MYNFDSSTTANGLLIETFIWNQNKYAYLKKIFPNSWKFYPKILPNEVVYQYFTGVENQSVLKSKYTIFKTQYLLNN